MKPLNRFILALTVFMSPCVSFAANPVALFILDGSGSMWGKVEGKAKIDLAKEAMTRLVKDFPTGVDMGLIAYGHRKEKDCDDIQVLAPLGSGKDSIISAVDSITPKGKTPLTRAIRAAAAQLKGRDAPASIVVVSDGKESCNADPCAAAKEVRAAGVDLKIHVIGFDVTREEAKQLQCIAANGGGKYFAAADAAELAKSFAAVKKEVVKKEAASKVIFRDDFDGEFLSDQWELVNPNEDAIIVEDGYLQIIAEQYNKKLFNPNNLVVLKRQLPKNYEVELKLAFSQLDPRHCRWIDGPMAGLLLFKDPDNVLALFAGHAGDCDNSDGLHFVRLRKGKWMPQFGKSLRSRKEDHPIILRLRREQRKFIAYWQVAKGKWVKLGEYAELRPNYRLALFATRSPEAREALEKFDWIEIRELK